jgi:multidrug resistance protein
MTQLDFEQQSSRKIPYFRRVYDQVPLTQEIIDWPYEGDGTPDDPYIVDWIENDPVNPQNLHYSTKWLLMVVLGISMLAVSFTSSSYVGGMNELIRYFDSNDIVISVGVALYVLGFGLGPILWAPLSEVYGRQIIMVVTYGIMTLFNIGAIFTKNLTALFLMRFFAGTFGASPLTNTGGQIADMYNKKQRGLALMLFATAPFLGPVLGPIAGGFLGAAAGWRWVMALAACFCGVCFISITLLVPETFAPVLLRKRAAKLAKLTGKVYVCHFDLKHGPPTLKEDLKISLTRPWLLLVFEPIVLVLTIYSAVVYGTYMMHSEWPCRKHGHAHIDVSNQLS